MAPISAPILHIVPIPTYSKRKKGEHIMQTCNVSRLSIKHKRIVVVVLLFYVHGKHLRSCRDGQLT